MKEDHHNPDQHSESPVFDRAADWFVRKERGLSPSEEEQSILEQSFDSSLRHEISRFEETKAKVQCLSPEFVDSMLDGELKRSSRFPYLAVWGSIAVMLVLGLSLYLWNVPESGNIHRQTVQSQTALYTHLLPDGSLIRLNIDAHLEVRYSEKERRIIQVKGEALFEVTPDPGRTFVVEVDGVEIRAVGTAFNVKRSEQIDVIVTHGIVEISAHPLYAAKNPENMGVRSSVPPVVTEKYVTVGQRAEISLNRDRIKETIEVFEVEDDEVEFKLDWRKSLLALNGENLVEMAASFEQKTGYRLVIGDPSLKNLRIGGRFPSNDVYGFLRILEMGYGIPWKQVDNGVIVLGNNLESN